MVQGAAPNPIGTQRGAPSPGQRLYVPQGVARELFYDQRDEVVLSGPAGTGKSRACLEKLYLVASKYPGMRGLIARKTRASLTQSSMVTFERKVLPEGSRVRFHTGDQEYRFPNGSTLVVGGLDNPIKIMSTDYDIVYVPEATELLENDWESLSTRLRNGVMPYQQIIADCNPGPPTHWLKKRVDRGVTAMLESRHEDNPTLWDRTRSCWTENGSRYIAKLDALSGVRKLRLRHGKWATADGMVYEDWDTALHLIDAMPAGWESWTKYRVIDFGYTNPFTCQWWAEDPDGRLYLYRELYGTQRLVEDWAADILLAGLDPRREPDLRIEYQAQDPTPPDTRQAFAKWLRTAHPEALERIVVTIADHDAEDRATLKRHGISTNAAHKEVSPGIQAVQARLRKSGDGRSRLYILRNALVSRDPELEEARKPASVIEEFDGYVWSPPQEGKPTKEEPVKRDDHGLDALRYMVYYRDRRVRDSGNQERQSWY